MRYRSWQFSWREPPADEDERLLSYAIRLGINAAALWLASEWVRGFEIDGWPSLLAMAAIFGLLNTFIRPVLIALSCPAIVLTLGFFTLIVNTILLALAAWIAGWFNLDVDVDGFTAAFLSALLITFVSWLLNMTVRGPLLRTFR